MRGSKYVSISILVTALERRNFGPLAGRVLAKQRNDPVRITSGDRDRTIHDTH